MTVPYLLSSTGQAVFHDSVAEVLLQANLDGYELRNAPGISKRVNDILGGQFAHHQCQIAFEGCWERASIDPLHVFRSASSTNQLHHEFCVRHSLLLLPGSSAERESLHR